MLYTGLKIPAYIYPKELLASSFMVMGLAYRKSKIRNVLENNYSITILGCLAIVVLGSFLWRCTMGSVTWLNIIPYFVSALAGTIMVYVLCRQVEKVLFISHILTFVGDRTLPILTWHLLSFKLISLVIIGIYGLPMAQLAEFPVIRNYTIIGWWIGYLAVGLVVPILLDSFGKSLKYKLNKKLYFKKYD